MVRATRAKFLKGLKSGPGSPQGQVVQSGRQKARRAVGVDTCCNVMTCNDLQSRWFCAGFRGFALPFS
jgi:hypothetical protein